MSSGFDPYYEWLGIPPAESANGGPHHYRLLGLQVFESNPRVIENAADRLMMQLRSFSAGPNGAQSQKLLNEVAAARVCLLNDKRKSAYDQPLRARFAAAAPQSQVAVQPIYVPVPVPVPVPTALPPMPAAGLAPPPPAEENFGPAWSGPAPAQFTLSSGPRRGRNRGKADGDGAIMGVLKVVLGGLGGLSIAVLGVWIFFRSDPFGLFEQPSPAIAANPQPTKTLPVEPNAAVQPESPKTPPPVKPSKSPAKPATAGEKTTEPIAEPISTPVPVREPGDARGPNMTPLPGTERPVVQPPGTPAAASAPSNRHPPPSNEEQQAKLAELKDVYQAEFESGLKPTGRDAFIEFLLGASEKLKSDPIARFVLLREAYLRLAASKDFSSAAEVVDRLDAEFEMDPFKLRLHLLIEASADAKLPADRLAIVNCASELVDAAIRRQRIGEAEKLVRIAEGQAKALSDNKLRAKMTALKGEVEKLAKDWSPIERARLALAANPSDAAAALADGRYRCLVEGDWKAGLALLAKCSDEPLASAAQQDQRGISAEVSAVAIADTWYEIARASDALQGFYARARHWYLQAGEVGDTLDRARIQQRIEQIGALNLSPRLLGESGAVAADAPLPSFYASYSHVQSFEPVDLFGFVQRQDLMSSPWDATTDTPPTLYSDSETAFSRLPARYTPPREYQLTIRVRRGSANMTGFPPREADPTGPFVIGLVGPKSPFMACLDLPVTGGEYASFLSAEGVKSPVDNPTLRRNSSAQIADRFRGESTIVCQVRRRSVSVAVNGSEACRYEGDLSNLALPKDWSINDAKSLFIGSHQCGFSVTGWSLEPLPPEPSLPPMTPGAFEFGTSQADRPREISAKF